MSKDAGLLFPGAFVTQCMEIAIRKARWHKGLFVTKDTAVLQFKGFHGLFSVNAPVKAPVNAPSFGRSMTELLAEPLAEPIAGTALGGSSGGS